MTWNPLTETEQIDQIVERSHSLPCLIFKHSTSCSISSIAKYRLEGDWPFSTEQMEVYFLDLLRYRNVSNGVAEQLGVYHESPQIILLSKGEVVLDASHLGISVTEIQEVLDFEKA